MPKTATWPGIFISRPLEGDVDESVDVRCQHLSPDGQMKLGMRFSRIKDFQAYRRAPRAVVELTNEDGAEDPPLTDNNTPVSGTAGERNTTRPQLLYETVVALGRPDRYIAYERLLLISVSCLFFIDIILLGLDFTATIPNSTGTIITIVFRAIADLFGIFGFFSHSWNFLAIFSIACAFQTLTYIFIFYDQYQAGRLVILVVLWSLSEIRRSQLQFFWFVPFR